MAVVNVLGHSPGGRVRDSYDPISVIVGVGRDHAIGVGDFSHIPIAVVLRKLGPVTKGVHHGLDLTPVTSRLRGVRIVLKGR